MEQEEHIDVVQGNMEYADATGVTGTPTLVINGQTVNALSYDDVVEIMDRESGET